MNQMPEMPEMPEMPKASDFKFQYDLKNKYVHQVYLGKIENFLGNLEPYRGKIEDYQRKIEDIRDAFTPPAPTLSESPRA